MKKKSLVLFSVLLIAGFIVVAFTNGSTITKHKATLFKFQEGDIIFQDINSEQGVAVKLATESEFSHVAVVVEHDGELQVLEAVQPVRIIDIESWIKQGENSMYKVGRLKNDSILSKENLALLRTAGKQYLNKNYDGYFNWSDDKIYCSELVYKMYFEALAIKLAPLKMLKDYNIDHPKVRRIMQQRYGDDIPYEDLMVSPEDLFKSSSIEILN